MYFTVDWNVQLKHGEWYSPVEQIKFAGIVSNPPYIPHSQMQHLQVGFFSLSCACYVTLHSQLLSNNFSLAALTHSQVFT